MQIGIIGIGTASPAFRQTQNNILEFMTNRLQLNAQDKRRLKAIYKSTGINYRHSVLEDFSKLEGTLEFFPNDPNEPFPETQARMKVYQKNALILTIKAIDNCFNEIPSFDKYTITHLITISCTGMYAPGLDIEIIQHLELAKTIQRTAINFMGCYGAFTGIKVAEAICRANPKAKVLLVSVELCSIHFQKDISLNSLLSSAIFADGAGAIVIQASPDQSKYFSLDHFYSEFIPEGMQDMTWSVGNQGFDMVLSPAVPRFIKSQFARFTENCLALKQLKIENIHQFAIHPGGKEILLACESALNITPKHNEFSYQVLQQHGNMSSATIIFVLKQIWNSLTRQKHDTHIYSCAFGPGITIESMILGAHHF